MCVHTYQIIYLKEKTLKLSQHYGAVLREERKVHQENPNLRCCGSSSRKVTDFRTDKDLASETSLQTQGQETAFFPERARFPHLRESLRLSLIRVGIETLDFPISGN